jgi:HlyD family secretion protein
MHRPNPRRVVPIVLLILAVLAAIWYYSQAAAADPDAPISASGTIEALEVRISPEVGGRIISLQADEGDTVTAGQLLVQLDDSLLKAQITQAESALVAAQANLEAVIAASGVTAAASETAQAVLRAAEANLALLQAGASAEQLRVAQTVVDKAQLAVDAAQETYDDLSDFARDTTQGKAIKQQLDQAELTLENALAQYDLLKAGARPQQIEAAQAQVDSTASQARAANRQTQASEAQVKAAQAQVDAAHAALNLLAVQQARFQINSPIAGTVLFRVVENGEVAAQGATLMVVSDLADLQMTVYIPEDRYGQIMLGQTARITIDSYTAEYFTARVVHIADKAEFTPRNVQTQEGRRTTVFAVRLKLDNQDGRLKPGMPADLVFDK